LSTCRTGFEHEHVETFRCSVYSGSEAGWSRADDDQIADLLLIDRLVEAKAVGDLLIRWIAQHRGAANHDGDIVDADVELIEQLLLVPIAVEVDVAMRMPAAGKELPDTQRAGGMRRPDNCDRAILACDQVGATQDECAHQDRAQLGVGLNQREEA
jgi:hypothetical protein